VQELNIAAASSDGHCHLVSQSDYDFSNKVVLITGASGSVGSRALEFFASHGATIIGTYLDEKKVNTTRTRSEAIDLIRCNTMKNADVTSLVSSITKKHDRIDILVNTVGGYLGGKSVTEIEEDEWNKIFGLNLLSAFLITKHVLPLMLQSGYGKIVHVSSYTGISAKGLDSAYASSKAALIRFVESVSKEVTESNLTVNCVLPSIIDTESNRKMMPHADFKQWVKIDELVNVIAFLSSDQSRAITGSAIPVLKPT
jgi:NAD(P)-dependent dehydrogenase (short-subunit alcohol dehydrogenase family)